MHYSVYLHLPFCRQRCHYCDFNTYAGKDTFIPAYIDALSSEIQYFSDHILNYSVHSLYFGGGTPSIIPLKYYRKIFKTLHKNLLLSDDCEITIEANPGTLELEYIKGLKGLGVNRLSIGVQSTNLIDLERLDRIHNLDHILQAVHNARSAGINNISMDMIFGLPWQDQTSWEHSLRRAIELNPEHFSLYSLIIEPNTPLFQWHQKGLIAPQDQDIDADMYEYAQNQLKTAGYVHYEISNWAKKDSKADFSCRHNQQYWLNQPYLGLGAGSHGYVDGIRTVNTKSIEDYISRMQKAESAKIKTKSFPAAISINSVEQKTQMQEFMMLGLRLIQKGVTEERFNQFYNQSMKEIFNEEINLLLKKGLVEWVEEGTERLKLTKRGVMVANQVFMAFV